MPKIVFNGHSDQQQDILFCQSCRKKIADYVNDIPVPDYATLYNAGNIPIPNFGWICSQSCAQEFEKENRVKFQKNSSGKIDYYSGNFK
jgi:hypothetical protein